MSNIEQLSVKQLIEKQGLTVHQLRTTLARLEKQGYGSLPVVLAADDEMFYDKQEDIDDLVLWSDRHGSRKTCRTCTARLSR